MSEYDTRDEAVSLLRVQRYRREIRCRGRWPGYQRLRYSHKKEDHNLWTKVSLNLAYSTLRTPTLKRQGPGEFITHLMSLSIKWNYKQSAQGSQKSMDIIPITVLFIYELDILWVLGQKCYHLWYILSAHVHIASLRFVTNFLSYPPIFGIHSLLSIMRMTKSVWQVLREYVDCRESYVDLGL